VAVQELDASYVVVKSATVRAAPDTGSQRLAMLAPDDVIAVTGKVKDRNWLRFSHQGKHAYVFGELVQEIDAREAQAWTSLRQDDLEGLERFVDMYPGSYFSEQANARVAYLGEKRAMANPPKGEAAVKICDRQAQRLFFASLPAGKMPLGMADAPLAMVACQAALNEDPGNARLLHQYGRALVGMQYDDRALKALQAAAAKGHVGAQFDLGVMYEHGYGVKKDAAEALKRYRQAASQNWPEALIYLGMAHMEGHLVQRNEAEGRKFLRRAADTGDEMAKLMLAMSYIAGQGAARNEAEALRLLRPLAESGAQLAQMILGGMYFAGQGVKQDAVEAHKWLMLSVREEQPGKLLRMLTKAIDENDAKMTPEQRADAKRRVEAWKPTAAN
jgi:TPR repeat protein